MKQGKNRRLANVKTRRETGLDHVMFNLDLNLSLIHISEPTRQAEISYAVFCLKKKKRRRMHEKKKMRKQPIRNGR